MHINVLLLSLVYNVSTVGRQKFIVVSTSKQWVNINVLLSLVYDVCTLGA